MRKLVLHIYAKYTCLYSSTYSVSPIVHGLYRICKFHSIPYGYLHTWHLIQHWLKQCSNCKFICQRYTIPVLRILEAYSIMNEAFIQCHCIWHGGMKYNQLAKHTKARGSEACPPKILLKIKKCSEIKFCGNVDHINLPADRLSST